MPRCAVRHLKLVAEADLPVLPFLAPRLLQPWPEPIAPSPSSRCLHTGRKHDLGDGLTQRTRFSTRSAGHARTGRHTPATLEKHQSSRSQLAHQWYDPAFAPTDEPQQQREEETQHRQGEATKPRGRIRRSLAQERQRNTRDTSRAIEKARWTAASRNHDRVDIRWTSLGHPVRRRSASDKEELAFSVDDHFLLWNHHFARLSQRYDARFKHLPAANSTPILSHEAPTWAAQILKAEEIENLEKLLGPRWRLKWLHAMLWTLGHSIGDAPRFLQITHEAPHLPASWIADSLSILARHYASNPISDHLRQELVHVFCTVMERPEAPPLRLSGGILSVLFRLLTEDQVLRLYESAVVNGVVLHWNTHLHFASFLARCGHYDRALDSLLDAVSDGADVKSPQFESNCATILRKAADQPDGLRVSLRLVQNLADIGVKLNVQLCNIVMLNAVEAGDLKTAFSIYHSLVDNNLRADKYTHAILLKGCKDAIQDSETLNTIIRQAIADTEILKSNVVATEIIHCLYLHHFEINPRDAFSTVADAYAQLFDTSSLIQLSILPQNLENASSNRMPPTPAALGIMITAFLRRTSTSTADGSVQHEVYRRWRMCVEQDLQPLAQLVETDYVPNAFLLAFIEHASSLPQAAEVIRDMQTPLATTSTSPESPINITPCKPTVQSWSIFLHGFSKHGKMNLAEQVLTYMRGRGMQPNQVTWNSLIGGYARLGDADGAVRAFRRMRDEGFRVNEVTERALEKVRLDRVSPEAWGDRPRDVAVAEWGSDETEMERMEETRHEELHEREETEERTEYVDRISDGVHAMSV